MKQWAGVLAVIVLITFLPALRAEFLNWDDPDNFLRNDDYRGLGWANLRWMATTFHVGVYQPLSWFLLSLQYVLFELNPVGYHLAGVLVHAAGAVVFFFVARRLVGWASAGPSAGRGVGLSLSALVAALLFAVHPLRVEPVVWISCQPYIVCAFFYLLTVHSYLRAQEMGLCVRKYHRRMAAAFLCAAAALLSKAPAVSLPGVLLILDVYPVRRLGGLTGWWGPAARRVWREKAPFVLAAVPIVVLAAISNQEGAVPLQPQGWAARSALSAYGIWFYLQKTLVPSRLLPYYELPLPLNPTEWRFVAAAVFVLVTTGLLVALRRRCGYLLAVWAGYVVILLPNLGVVPHGAQLAANRYSHLACLGWAVLVGGGLWRLWQSGQNRLAGWLTAFGLALSVVLGGLTWQQVGRWQTSDTLWTYTVAHTRDCRMAHLCLGTAKLDRGEYAEAIVEFREVLRLRPNDAPAHYNLGLAWRRQGQNDRALEEFTRAVELKSGYAEALYNSGNILFECGEHAEALAAFRRAAEAAPKDRDIGHNLGVVLYTLGRHEEAVAVFREVVRWAPQWVEGYVKLAKALKAQGRRSEAAQVLQKALELAPNHAGARQELQALAGAPSR